MTTTTTTTPSPTTTTTHTTTIHLQLQLKIMGSRPWPFGVTWRHRSRDHSTRGGRLPIGGPLWQCVYLAPL